MSHFVLALPGGEWSLYVGLTSPPDQRPVPYLVGHGAPQQVASLEAIASASGSRLLSWWHAVRDWTIDHQSMEAYTVGGKVEDRVARDVYAGALEAIRQLEAQMPPRSPQEPSERSTLPNPQASIFRPASELLGAFQSEPAGHEGGRVAKERKKARRR